MTSITIHDVTESNGLANKWAIHLTFHLDWLLQEEENNHNTDIRLKICYKNKECFTCASFMYVHCSIHRCVLYSQSSQRTKKKEDRFLQLCVMCIFKFCRWMLCHANLKCISSSFVKWTNCAHAHKRHASSCSKNVAIKEIALKTSIMKWYWENKKNTTIQNIHRQFAINSWTTQLQQ